jgi:hypothetical protein
LGSARYPLLLLPKLSQARQRMTCHEALEASERTRSRASLLLARCPGACPAAPTANGSGFPAGRTSLARDAAEGPDEASDPAAPARRCRLHCPKLCEDRGAALALPAAMLCATCPREFTALCLGTEVSLSFWLLRLLAANRFMPEKRSSAAASRGPHLPPRRSYAVPVRAVQSIAGNTPKKSRRHLRPFAPLGPSTSCSAALPSAALPRHSL